MSNNFIHNISKYTPLILLCTFLMLLAPDNVKIIRNSKVSVSLKDVIGLLSVVFLIYISIIALKN